GRDRRALRSHQASRRPHHLRAGRRGRLADPGLDPPFPARAGTADHRTRGGHAGRRGVRLKSSLCATIAVALAWPAAPALAQGERPSPTLSRFYFRLADGPRALSRMVGCLVNQNTEGARRLFDLDYGTPPQIQATSEFNKHGGNCLFGTNGLRSTNLMFMGAVAVE